jgi:tetratricopeptide (TPR) repeat protein
MGAPEVRFHVARAHLNKSMALVQLERPEEALAACDASLAWFRGVRVVLHEWVAQTLLYKAVALVQLERHEEAAALYADVARRLEDSDEPEMRVLVAESLLRRALVLGEMEKHEESLAAHDEVVRRFADAEAEELRELVARTLVFKATFLGRLGRRDEELATFAEVGQRFAEAAEPPLRLEAARALICRAELLLQLRRVHEGLAGFDDVLARFGGATDVPLRERVTNALNTAGFKLLCEAKRLWPEDRERAQMLLEEARLKIATALERRPGYPMALGNAGYIAFLQGRREEARSLLVEALRLGGEKVRETELKDSAIHSVPEDEAFRELVRAM